MDNKIVEIGGTSYVLKLFSTTTALNVVNKLEKQGFSPEVVFEVVSKGAGIGSVAIDQKKFDKHFAGKIKELMELFGEVLKYNNLLPEGDEGNESDSDE